MRKVILGVLFALTLGGCAAKQARHGRTAAGSCPLQGTQHCPLKSADCCTVETASK